MENKTPGCIRNKCCYNRAISMICSAILLFQVGTQAQDSSHYKIIQAGPEYKKGAFYQWLWGKHYREEWSTPVSVKIVMLDTLAGGLTPYEMGGSRQTRSVRLRDKNNREYVLRTVDKTFSAALPDVAKGSFIEDLANDQVSIANPYAALTIAPMAEAAKVFHTNPQIYYIPKQKALGQYNDEIGDKLYLFEQRPDENWETASNFGNAKKIIGTDKLLEKTLKGNDNQVDQLAFARARLFDMFIGDWGRHEDQWRWAAFEDGKTTIYKPVPRDRDQAYTLFDGRLLKATKGLAAPHLQSFDDHIKRIGPFNYPSRNLDRHFLNEVSLEQWKAIAADMQRLLTDKVIDNAVKQLPPEVYPLSGPEIAKKLKARRNLLNKWAVDYYRILAKSVDVTGSEKRDFFEVKRINDFNTQVNIYKIKEDGSRKDIPYYSRTFRKGETFEVRLYGIGGQDEYLVTGNTKHSISVRLIGGYDRDKFTDLSTVKGIGHKTEIYDDKNNDFKKTKETSIHTSPDSAIHAFKYASYKFDKRGFNPIFLYNNEDRIYVGIAYTITKNKWRKEPYRYKQYFDVKYSIMQKAFSTTYKSTFTKLLGNWDAVFYANFDFERWTNFFGLGNDTKLQVDNRQYNRLRSQTYIGNIGAERRFGKHNKVYINGFYQGVRIKNDTTRYISKTSYDAMPDTYKNNQFAGVNLGYVYQSINDSVLPTKGIGLLLYSNYTQNLRNAGKSFGKAGTELNLYYPFTKNLGIMVKGGGSTLFGGTPEFYQYNHIGSSATMRGYRRDRFYGNSAFFNQNELRWISNVHSYLYNGKIGVFALYDMGRVWLDGEKSNTMHHSYGGGIILSPYNKIAAVLSYAVSPEDKNFHINIIKVF